jgi:HAD superfamily hydrolase (TIGR01509 family)
VSSALQAIVFDFDGVIADSEPLHLRAFQRAFADVGLTLTATDYYSRYLGFDDAGVFAAVARDCGATLTGGQIASLVAQKGEYVQQLLRAGEILFPGAAEFVRTAAAAVPIAIASGAQRHEIEEILNATQLRGCFATIVAAGETVRGKPAPDPYARAFQLLQRSNGATTPGRCVAIEDSRWGLESARGAGLRCVGVTTSYPASDLPGAELIVEGLNTLTIQMLEELVKGPPKGGHYRAAVGRVPLSTGAARPSTDAQGVPSLVEGRSGPGEVDA